MYAHSSLVAPYSIGVKWWSGKEEKNMKGHPFLLGLIVVAGALCLGVGEGQAQAPNACKPGKMRCIKRADREKAALHRKAKNKRVVAKFAGISPQQAQLNSRWRRRRRAR